ncbi:tRNA 2-thiouridine(34) synthase MnmA [Candidatus Kuenenbacteria bacterium HGW-Kuenenbacteria-1]|uniref:tRNA-specific 2-thiouridylase MnmA n=1 Tax=Candidatus Kuenenbacteria bacterium HGW-Kuenenbacteria-1 TaxID=2013812 RepID=A0A2N1UNG6_9BACT|nr:MAG: tRNA 2-thiouridine(34) synthase MnmA [Candidatus Kuenenbacteria bacterium HGW-Kuenenbacteria-1]
MNNQKQIVVGMSGGVDSSMALVLLKKQGWKPIGVSLKYATWQDSQYQCQNQCLGVQPPNIENACCSTESFKIARNVCKKLNVPFHIINVSKDFKEKVINYFISELKNCKTPNPCVICNRHLKFKKLFEFAKKHNIKYVATGHYARKLKIKNPKLQIPNKSKTQNPKLVASKVEPSKIIRYQLLTAKDTEKDQTYSLSFLPQKWLKYIIFPLGNYTKTEIYKMAVQKGFEFFLKQKQSQDFCFIDKKSIKCFLEKEIGKKQGLIKDTKGNILGKHFGLHFYTIGQRKGIKLPKGPYFVANMDILNNILIITKNEKKLYRKEILCSPFHFISGILPENKIRIKAKIRYRQSSALATLFYISKTKIKIIFDQPQRAITPGQFAVFYSLTKISKEKDQKNICLGGGIIIK